MTTTVHAAPPRRQPLTVAEATALATRLAQKIAHRFDDVDDLVQTGLLKLHITLGRKASAAVIKKRGIIAFAKMCMQREMWRYYSAGGKSRRALDRAASLDVEHRQGRLGHALLDFAYDPDLEGRSGPEAHTLPNTPAVQTELLELSEYFALLEQRHGVMARRVAENLLAPQDVRCCQYILKRGELSVHTIRQGLGLDLAEWNRLLGLIREFTRAWVKQ